MVVVGIRESSRVGITISTPHFGFNLLGSSSLSKSTEFFGGISGVSLLSVMGCASTAKHEGTSEYLDDSVITAKVKAAILGDPALKVAEINVETFKGVVQLSGFVSSQAEINKAVELTGKVDGVVSVKNDMHVK
ncbi:MAG: BON domain-containing protein [Proteobacteria bacterium]|nr:BON domain-containing protein [Pseudomonadota bacterium]